MSKGIRVSVLVEDQATMGFRDRKFSGQHGLALFIEGERKILFDTGPSGVLLDNAGLMGIDLNTAEWIVLSHGHWDHADGLIALRDQGIRTRLLLHPDAFADRRKSTGEFNGMALEEAAAKEHFDLVLSREPYQLSQHIYFLGEIPRNNDFEAKNFSFTEYKDAKMQTDELRDDTALAIKGPGGVSVITGCSHSGICNICEHAKAVTGETSLDLVMGGFHLLRSGDLLNRTIDYFKAQGPVRLYPNHCTCLEALTAFHHTFGIEKLSAGDCIEI